MRKILIVIASAAVTLFLLGAVINIATARSVWYLQLAVPVLATVILVFRRIRKRNLHLRMADVILDPRDCASTIAPVNNLEKEINQAILRNRAILRSRRAERVARRWRTSKTIRILGHPK